MKKSNLTELNNKAIITVIKNKKRKVVLFNVANKIIGSQNKKILDLEDKINDFNKHTNITRSAYEEIAKERHLLLEHINLLRGKLNNMIKYLDN